jgi:YbgC/YbaW family acyl-CoA thioester hydrolase
MAHEYCTERRVEFSDTDMAGIMHFANFFRWMESTEHAFFRSLGFAVHGEENGATVGWVRVHAECDYLAPLRYPELVEVRLRVTGKSSNSLSYAFEFRRADEAEGDPAARGALQVVHVARPSPGERLRSADMPAEVSASIEVAPPMTEGR